MRLEGRSFPPNFPPRCSPCSSIMIGA